MRLTSPVRRIALVALIALLGVIGLVTVVSFAPTGVRATDQVSTGAVTGHPNGAPDTVGVTQSRPLGAIAPLLIAPGGAVPALASIVTVGALLLAGARAAAEGARLRRWRALLVGAPPVSS